jgi:hypothetical protein
MSKFEKEPELMNETRHTDDKKTGFKSFKKIAIKMMAFDINKKLKIIRKHNNLHLLGVFCQNK